MTLQEILDTINDNYLWGTWLLYVLIGVGVLYTIITGGVQIRHFGLMFKKAIFDGISKKKNKVSDSGAISSFQALCTNLASCVGAGNIVGVGTAILSGGPGAVFWMWVAAFFGMATKYGEVVLSMLFRERTEDGKWAGGAMFYIKKGLKLPWLASFAALAIVIQNSGGGMVQSNTVSGVLSSNFGIPVLVTGLILMAYVIIVSLGGLKRVANVASKMVPFMALLYLVFGLVVLFANITKIPGAFGLIFSEAFSFKAAAGGVGGYVITRAMRYGVARGLYSNEAGEGVAGVVHSSADVKHPVEQGLAGAVEVFIDTFVICTISALVIVVTGAYQFSDVTGATLAIEGFATLWAPLKYIVVISLVLFCSSTLMAEWFLGYSGLHFVFGEKVASKFKYVFPIFCVIGALTKIELVWTIQDMALALLTIPNLIAMLILFPLVKKATKEYFSTPSLSQKYMEK